MMTQIKLNVVWILIILTGSACRPAADEPLPCGSPELEERSEKLFADGDYKTVYAEMLRCAEAGEPEAQFALGTLIAADEEGVVVDLSQEERERRAILWFRTAAATGHEEALGTLADSYEYGWLGLPQDSELARCFRSAIEEPERIPECLDQSDPTDHGAQSGAEKKSSD